MTDSSVSDSSSATLSSSSSSDDSSDDSSNDSSDDSSSSSKGSSQGASTWAKAFAFMHNTDNPVVGNKASRADTGSHHHHPSSSRKKEDPLKEAAQGDKFLAGFEDPDSSDSTKTKLSTTRSHHKSSADVDNPDSPLDKGSDPLKSAETDKFLAGFLGRR